MGRPSAFLQSSGPLLPRYISIDRARGRVAASVQWPAQGARIDNPTHVVGFVKCVHSMQTREENILGGWGGRDADAATEAHPPRTLYAHRKL